MKKIISIIISLLFLFLCAAPSSAQDNRYIIGLRYGYSLPMGQFASQEYKYGAYALLGSSFEAEATWYFHKSIGFGMNYSMSYYQVATGYFLEDLQNDTTNPSAVYNFLKSDPYTVSSYMAGFYYRLPVTERIGVSFKGMGGLCKVKTPYQFYSGTYLIGNLFHITTPAESSKFSVLFGATVQYKLFDHVILLMESEFSYVESKFTFWKNGYTTKEIHTLKMPLFKVQPGINITF
jgi:hypothetical protein